MQVEIRVDRKVVGETTDDSIKNILDLHPDEELFRHRIFNSVWEKGRLNLGSEFVRSCSSMGIYWQMLFLTPDEQKKQIESIRAKRNETVLFIANRPGSDTKVSTRMVDRIVGLQEFLNKEHPTATNKLLGSRKNGVLRSEELSKIVLGMLQIEMTEFRGMPTKQKALNYLIGKVEAQGFGVAQVVYDYRLLPKTEQNKKAYSKSSGFLLYDQFYPFIFLPSERKHKETPGRRIYTLLFLFVLAVMGVYNIVVTNDDMEKYDETSGGMSNPKSTAHNVVNEILLPTKATTHFAKTGSNFGKKANKKEVLRLAKVHRITPLATLVILARRERVNPTEFEEIEKELGDFTTSSKGYSDKLSASEALQKLYGKNSGKILKSRDSGNLTSTQFEHLCSGMRNKRLTVELIREGVLRT